MWIVIGTIAAVLAVEGIALFVACRFFGFTSQYDEENDA